MFVENDRLDTSQAQKAWAGVGTLLAQAVSELEKTASSSSKRLASFGLSQRQSCSPAKKESTSSKVLNDVGENRESKRAPSLVFRTPFL